MELSEIRLLGTQEKKELAEKIEDCWVVGGRTLVAKSLQINYGSVLHACDILGINLSRVREIRRNNLREGNFGNPFLVEGHLKYYLFGFILGDGSLRCSRTGYWSLNLSQSNREFIEELSTAFKGCRITGPVKGNYTIDLYDNALCKPLVDAGFVPNKSKVGMRCPDVPDEFYFSFLAGLLDSDGVICRCNRASLQISWYGHHSYMSDIFKRLCDFGYHPTYKTVYGRKESFKELGILTTSEAVSIFEKLYKDTPISYKLKRSRGEGVFNCRNMSLTQSREIDSRIKNMKVPTCSAEIDEMASVLGITSNNVRKRLSRLGLYKANYKGTGSYVRKHKEN